MQNSWRTPDCNDLTWVATFLCLAHNVQNSKPCRIHLPVIRTVSCVTLPRVPIYGGSNRNRIAFPQIICFLFSLCFMKKAQSHSKRFVLTLGFCSPICSLNLSLGIPCCFSIFASTLSEFPNGVAAPGRWFFVPPAALYLFSIFWTPGVWKRFPRGLRLVYWRPARPGTALARFS